jgi:allantoate deiminase
MGDQARTVMQRIEALGRITDEPGCLTRTFCSPGMARANKLVASWMRQAGMETRSDAVGNLIGRYPHAAKHVPAKVLLIGSHLDTVRDAGKFDGPLGVLVAIACVQKLREDKRRLPFAIEAVGFADEEGVRYRSTYLGSRALAGTFDRTLLKTKDEHGISMADAIRKFGGNPGKVKSAKLDGRQLAGYVEVHIEQGPVLEQRKMPLGVVSTIAGQTRSEYRFAGQAGHAGTVPMKLRRDALCAAAEFSLAVEHRARMVGGLVATVGQFKTSPGATNVIPGDVVLSLDVRHAEDEMRKRACAQMKDLALRIGAARKVQVSTRTLHEAESVVCDRRFSQILNTIVKKRLGQSITLASGAGHDGAALAAITPVAMLFVRCRDGVSHHPDESASVGDIREAIAVMNDFILQLAGKS